MHPVPEKARAASRTATTRITTASISGLRPLPWRPLRQPARPISKLPAWKILRQGKRLWSIPARTRKPAVIATVGTAGATTVEAATEVGATAIPVASAMGFVPGETITIDSGANAGGRPWVASRRQKRALPTITVSAPLKFAHAAWRRRLRYRHHANRGIDPRGTQVGRRSPWTTLQHPARQISTRTGRQVQDWCSGRDSNPRFLVCRTRALAARRPEQCGARARNRTSISTFGG